MKLLAFPLFFILSACGQSSNKISPLTVDPKAKKLNDSATLIAMKQQDYKTAISLLDKATHIDSNYFAAYRNKLTFELDLKNYDEALKTSLKILQLRPNNPNHYFTTGLIFDLHGDSSASKKYYNESAKRYDKILDTMSVSNSSYDMLLMNKGINLIFLGEQQKGNDILKQLYNRQKETPFKEMLAEIINKSKQDIINTWTNPKTVEVDAQPK